MGLRFYCADSVELNMTFFFSQIAHSIDFEVSIHTINTYFIEVKVIVRSEKEKQLFERQRLRNTNAQIIIWPINEPPPKIESSTVAISNIYI